MTEPTRLSLIGRLRDGNDPQAWRIFADIYGRMIMRWLMAKGIDANDAEDVRQEVLAAVYDHIESFSHNGRLGAFRKWLRSITVNRLHRLVQVKKRHEGNREHLTWIAEQLSDHDSELTRRWDREHEREIVLAMLDEISAIFSPTSVEAFRRLAIDGQSAAQVAADLDLSPGALRVTQHRVIRRLRELIAQMSSIA